MSTTNSRWRYTRQDLRKATKFVEGEYTGINPRQFYRTLKRNLEEIQEMGDFKYQTEGGQENNLEIESEQVGEKTGTVKGRLVAESDWRKIGSGSIEYKPYGPYGALGIVLGLLLAIFGIGEAMIALLGVGIALAGGYYYFQTETASFPIHRQDAIRVLITGEVSERTINTAGESHTDIFANMSVIYAGDAFIAVDTNELDGLDWPLRRAVVHQVKRWYNQLIDDDMKTEELQDGFIGHLSSWSNRGTESDRRKINNLQEELLRSAFETRLKYSNLLRNQLPDDVANSLEQHQDVLLTELEDLADDLDIYVDREGLETVDQNEMTG